MPALEWPLPPYRVEQTREAFEWTCPADTTARLVVAAVVRWAKQAQRQARGPYSLVIDILPPTASPPRSVWTVAGRLYDPLSIVRALGLVPRECQAQIPNPAATQYIYRLVDPLTGVVRYIGQTTDPDQRLHAHVTQFAGLRSNRKQQWIATLLRMGASPELQVVETIRWEGITAEQLNAMIDNEAPTSWNLSQQPWAVSFGARELAHVRYVLAREARWIAYGLVQGWPLTNAPLNHQWSQVGRPYEPDVLSASVADPSWHHAAWVLSNAGLAICPPLSMPQPVASVRYVADRLGASNQRHLPSTRQPINLSVSPSELNDVLRRASDRLACDPAAAI